MTDAQDPPVSAHIARQIRIVHGQRVLLEWDLAAPKE
jgi:hypothetical protein